MFENISWQCYWTTIVLCSIVYYLSVYLLYFRKESGIHTKQVGGSAVAVKTRESSSFCAEGGETATIEEKQEQSCLDEINAFFEAQKKSKAVKKELIYGLRGIVQKYFSLNGSPYQQALSNVMIMQAETICSVHLDDEEIKEVWLD
jgi:hypothetical protein